MTDGLWAVKMCNKGFFTQSNFASGGLCTCVSYKPLHTRSGLTVDCSANAKGRQGGERGNVSSHTCILEGNMRHSVYPIELEFSCLGYICTTGLELQCCKNTNRAACNRDSPCRSQLVW